jgi:hypothetical protein
MKFHSETKQYMKCNRYLLNLVNLQELGLEIAV